jgi:hypothetical protein
MNGSKFLKIATWAVVAPLAFLLLGALRSGPGGVERAVLIGFCLAPTAITFYFANWIERIERTARIQSLAGDRGLLLRLRAGVACSLLALAWAGGSIIAAPQAEAFDLATATVVLGPMIISLALASHAIEGAVERVTALAEN